MPNLRECSPEIAEQWKLESLEVFFISIPCTPEIFIERAVHVGHPKGFDVHMEPGVYEAIQANFCRDPYPLAKLRIAFVKKWTSRAKESQQDENKLHSSLPLYLQQVLSGKRLLLLGEMMEEAKCPDVGLVQDIRQGFRISGWMPLSGNSRQKVKRPAMSMETLLVLANGLNKSVFERLGSRQDPELEASAWQETQKELAAGWTWLANDSDASGLVIALRFALRQGPTKVRLIDECAINGLNNTIGLRECFDLHTIDKLAAMAVQALGDASEEGLAVWVGRTFDLRSAYKQYGIHPSDRQRLRVGVNQPGCKRPVLLGVNSLPFGATGSVSAFLRVAMAVWRVGLVLLKLVWSSFFDDFSNITRSVLANNTKWAIETLFDLLGIDFDRDGKKAPPYSSVFQMLGLQVDLSTSANRKIMIGHTDSRRDELASFLRGILDAGEIEPRAFERLRGRMVFFEGYSFGRVPSCAVRALASACKTATSLVTLNAELKSAIAILLQRVATAEPLCVQPISRETWILFTDGACEPDRGWGGIGAVLFGPNGQVAGFFGESVSQDIMGPLLKKSKNPIFELELAPILISLEQWRSILCGAQLACYLDNEGARHTRIRCYAHLEPANAWTAMIVGMESALGLKSWHARVGTSSNIADGPSSAVKRHLSQAHVAQWEQVATRLEARCAEIKHLLDRDGICPWCSRVSYSRHFKQCNIVFQCALLGLIHEDGGGSGHGVRQLATGVVSTARDSEEATRTGTQRSAAEQTAPANPTRPKRKRPENSGGQPEQHCLDPGGPVSSTGRCSQQSSSRQLAYVPSRTNRTGSDSQSTLRSWTIMAREEGTGGAAAPSERSCSR